MASSEILSSVDHGIGRIVLNRPEKRNALNRAAMMELTSCVRLMDEDPLVRVVIITGAGEDAFCSGADINEFLVDDPAERRNQNGAYRQLCQTILDCRKPLIGAVNGSALAGGAGLVLLFDFVLASDKARFGFPEIRAGIFPMMVTANLFRVVGRRKGLELVLTGELVDAAEAERIGLINRAVPRDQLVCEVDALAAKLARLSSSAIKLGKEAMSKSADMTGVQRLDYLQEMATAMLMTEEAQNALKSTLAARRSAKE